MPLPQQTSCLAGSVLVSEKGFDEVLLLGGLGGRRVEHTLANLCTGLGLERRGVRTTLLDERSRITYVMPGETRRYPKEKYFFFSAFPMEGRAQGVCERGSYYELTAGLKGIFHAHGILAVGQNAALYALAAHLRLDLGMGHPYCVFMLFFHYNTTSFPIQTQKAAASRQSLPGCRRAQSFGISSAITGAACRCKPECRHRRTGSGH